jgi:hypothetical protein
MAKIKPKSKETVLFWIERHMERLQQFAYRLSLNIIMMKIFRANQLDLVDFVGGMKKFYTQCGNPLCIWPLHYGCQKRAHEESEIVATMTVQATMTVAELIKKLEEFCEKEAGSKLLFHSVSLESKFLKPPKSQLTARDYLMA